MQIDSNKNVLSLKKLISTKCRKISVEHMGLKLGTNYMLNDQWIKDVPGLSSGCTLYQTKAPLSLIPGIKVTTNEKYPDILTLDDSDTCERAMLPCGHAICSESMLSLI